MGDDTEQLEIKKTKIKMITLIIFNTKYRKVKIHREFKDKNHVENYIALMHKRYGWMVDELFY